MLRNQELTTEILESPLRYGQFLTSLTRQSEQETESIFKLAVSLGATPLQLFNLAGLCYGIQNEWRRRCIDFQNFFRISRMGLRGFNMPKKQELTIYRGLHVDIPNPSTTSEAYIKNYISDARCTFESWTMNKEVAEFFSKGNGLILKAKIMSDSDLIIGLNVYGNTEEAELILTDGDIDFELELIKRERPSSNWGKCETWMREFLNNNELEQFSHLMD